MEEKLDEVEHGQEEWVNCLTNSSPILIKLSRKAKEEMEV